MRVPVTLSALRGHLQASASTHNPAPTGKRQTMAKTTRRPEKGELASESADTSKDVGSTQPDVAGTCPDPVVFKGEAVGYGVARNAAGGFCAFRVSSVNGFTVLTPSRKGQLSESQPAATARMLEAQRLHLTSVGK